jgi:hypothetical protein
MLRWISLALFTLAGYAQQQGLITNFRWKTATAEELSAKSSTIDPSAEAEILDMDVHVLSEIQNLQTPQTRLVSREECKFAADSSGRV